MNNRANEWELSKENVQPLRQGRKFSSLTAALQPESNETTALKQEKHEFEAELRTYSGDDPLDVWYRYLQWTEQAYPKGGKDSSLTQLMERCLKTFKSDQRYHNDERYVTTWIKYANVCKEPEAIFSFMHDQGIGSGLACLYESWAWALEQVGNTKRADSVYQKGVQQLAQPIELLERRHQEFQKRVARGAAQNVSTEENDYMDFNEEQRTVLGHLKSSGKHSKVSVNRTGPSKLPNRGGLGLRVNPASNQLTGSVQIFNDENQNPEIIPANTGLWSQAPQMSQMNKENEKKAGVWSKAKMSQKSGTVPFHAVNSQSQPSFTVHVEENADSSMMTPRKPNLEVGNQVLSARKPEKFVDPCAQMRHESDPLQKSMYCKDKVYCGTEEYSLEEVRAACWFAKVKKEEERQRLEAEKREIEAHRVEMVRCRQEMREEAERIRLERLALHAEHQAMIEQCKQQLQVQQAQFHSERQLHLQQQQESLVRDIETRMAEQMISSPKLPMTSLESSRRSDPHTSQNSLEQSRRSDPHTSQNSLESSRRSDPHISQNSLESSRHSDPHTSQNSLESSRRSDPHTSQNSLESSRRSDPHTSQNSFEQLRHTGLHITQNSLEQSRCKELHTSQKKDTSALKQLTFDNRGSNSETQQSLFPHTSQDNYAATNSSFLPGYSVNSDTPSMAGKSILSVSQERCPSSGRPDSRRSIAAPSPTVTTKQAIQLVQGMFNASLEIDKYLGFDDNLAPSIHADADMAEPAQASGAIGFAIYDETEEKKQAPQISEIYIDKENLPSENRKYGQTEMLLSEPPGSVKGLEGNKEVSQGPSMIYHDQNTMDYYNEERMDGIESQAKDDFTIAAVGSHLSFAASARIASTPFHANPSNVNFDRKSGTSESNDKESISLSQGHLQQTSEAAQDVSMKEANLSPIMEGSNEDSSSHHTTSGGFDSVFTKSTNKPHQEHSALQAENDMYNLSPQDDLNNQSVHVIDTSGYVQPELDEKTEALMSMSIRIDPHNPFDEDTIKEFLKMLSKPLHLYSNYLEYNEDFPFFRPESCANIGHDTYSVEQLIGKGGYASVYKATFLDFTSCDDYDETLALKVQKPPNPWEFYICMELQERLIKLNDPVDVRPSMLSVRKGYFFNDTSCLVTEYCNKGSLLDLVNRMKVSENLKSLPECLAAYLTIELLHMVEKLHRCQIIHGDIKPDNFMLLDLPELKMTDDPEAVFHGSKRSLMLIDFGQSIDMTKYPQGTTFMSKVATSDFQCIEMKTNRPWTYQTDLYGLIGTIHVVIFGQYMKIFNSRANNEWNMTSSINRSWNSALWKNLFHTLLNIPSCDELPDLRSLRIEFEQYFAQNLQKDFIAKYHKMRFQMIGSC